MSTEANKALVRRHFAECITRGDPAAMEELLAPDYQDFGVIPGLPRPLPDRATFQQVIAAFHAAFPGLELTPEGEMVAEGDQVAARFRFRGTHRGELMGIPPTGNEVTITGLALYRIVGGKILQAWVEEDIYGMMQQLGVVPAPDQATG
jgi:predicted ester cyclase